MEVPCEADAIVAFLEPLAANRIWGVGRVTEQKLLKHGITTIGDIQRCDAEKLIPILGENYAPHLWALAHGRDERRVQTSTPEKSISNERTFRQDVCDHAVLRQTLLELAEKVGRRMRRAGFFARTASIKLRFSDFKTITRQQTFDFPTNTDRNLLHSAFSLFENEDVRRSIRLIGFGVDQLLTEVEAQAGQLTLFPEIDPVAQDEHDSRLDDAVDAVREIYGTDAIKRGTPRET